MEKSVLSELNFGGNIIPGISEEHILPDTYPDIKKILRIKARAVPLGHFVSGKRIEFNGAVDFTVWFSADGENGDELYCVHFASDYRDAVSDGAKADSASISISAKINACNAGLQNPRKVSLHAEVLSQIEAFSDASSNAEISGDASGLEEKTVTLPTLIKRKFCAAPVKVSEDMELDSSYPEIEELISCDAALNFYEAKPSPDAKALSIGLKGDVNFDCIYKAKTGEYRHFAKRLPVNTVVDASEYADDFKDSITGSICALAKGSLSEINVNISTDGYDENRIIEADISFDVMLTLCADRETRFTLDAYSTVHPCKCIEKNYELRSSGKLTYAGFSVNESVSKTDAGIPDGAIPVSAYAQCEISAEPSGHQKTLISGIATVNCIYTNGNELGSCEISIPVKCEIQSGELNGAAECECEAVPWDLRVRFDRERVNCDFELAVCLEITRKSEITALAGINIGSEIRDNPQKKAVITVCYPSREQTLWDIAKAYGTTVEAIKNKNRNLNDAPNVVVIP